MPVARMHRDEVATDASLVRRLLAAQFPHWADLEITRCASSGTDNALYRLGDALAVRLPRIHWAVGQVEKEQRWLPVLAPHLPLEVPVPLAMGMPGEGYPWRWSVTPWLPGANPTAENLGDRRQAALDLARFVVALHGIDATDGPAPGEHNSGRGVPLHERDGRTRAAIASLDGTLDTREMLSAWNAALAAPAWDRPRVWVHGDLEDGNLLVAGGRLSAVIDFGCLGVGDPACDLLPAWSLFAGEARDAFRTALSADEVTWARGRGWALSTAVIALPYYRHTNPVIADRSRVKIAEVLADHRRSR